MNCCNMGGKGSCEYLKVKQERRKVDKKDGAVDHCRTANRRWKLIGGEEEQAGAKAQQKKAPGLSSGPSTLPPPLVIPDYQFFLSFFPNSTRIYPHSTRLVAEILPIYCLLQYFEIFLLFNAIINSQFLFSVTSPAQDRNNQSGLTGPCQPPALFVFLA
jgi:hypothetical protein